MSCFIFLWLSHTRISSCVACFRFCSCFQQTQLFHFEGNKTDKYINAYGYTRLKPGNTYNIVALCTLRFLLPSALLCHQLEVCRYLEKEEWWSIIKHPVMWILLVHFPVVHARLSCDDCMQKYTEDAMWLRAGVWIQFNNIFLERYIVSHLSMRRAAMITITIVPYYQLIRAQQIFECIAEAQIK